MPQPPSIIPVESQGPNFDPMDLVVQDLISIETLLLQMDPHDLSGFEKCYRALAPLQNIVAGHIDLLSDEPYHFSHTRRAALHKQNAAIFLNLEGLAGATQPLNEAEFKKFMKVIEQALSNFDNELIP